MTPDLCDVCLCAIAEVCTEDVQREAMRVVSTSYCTDCYHAAFFSRKPNDD